MGRLVVFFLVVVTLGLAILLAYLGWVTVTSNLLGWFLLTTGFTYFLGIILVYWIRKVRFWRPQAKGDVAREERNDWSFWAIAFGMISAFYLPPLEYQYFSAVLPRTLWMQAAGLSLILIGSVLFLWARRTLGKYYSGHASVLEGQPLVQSGPYRFIRHPAYAGYLLIASGIAFGYSSLAGIIVIPVLLLPSVIYRMAVEDKMLAEHFGEKFKTYAHKTARLIPQIW